MYAQSQIETNYQSATVHIYFTRDRWWNVRRVDVPFIAIANIDQSFMCTFVAQFRRNGIVEELAIYGQVTKKYCTDELTIAFLI